jgi:hypothetical protein
MKAYRIAPVNAPPPAPETLRSAFEIVEQVLREADADGGAHGVGFLGIHDGRRGTFLFVDWWADDKELHHRGFYADDRHTFVRTDVDDAIACVWDLHLLAFEGHAWHHEVIRGRMIERYLTARLVLTF